MDMLKKRERHRRFWQPLEKGEGGYLAVLSPIDDKTSAPPVQPPEKLEDQWLSVEHRLKVTEWEAANIYWGQDAIHCPFVNFGPGVQAALLGGNYRFTRESVWFDLAPIIDDWDKPPPFVTNHDHVLYKAIETYTRSLCENAQGRYYVAYTDIGGQYDVLYSLRGEELLMDFLDYPDEVQAAESQIDNEFIKYFNTLTGIIGPTGCGYTNWIPLVSDTPWYPIQCDLSVMISPRMFEDFALPSLEMVSKAMGQTIYHLDGPGEIQHLDMILSLKNLHAIQWVPLTLWQNDGYVYQSFDDDTSLDIYRRSKEAGKKVVILGVRPNQIAKIYETVGSDGVYILSRCTTRKDAEDLISRAWKDWLK